MPKLATLTFLALATATTAGWADDASDRRAARWQDRAPAVQDDVRLATQNAAEPDSRYISDDAAYRRAHRFEANAPQRVEVTRGDVSDF